MKFYFTLIISLFAYVVFSQNKKETLYLIPGQGSDYRIYKNIKFPNFDTVHIHYIIPDKKETMASYARKLSRQIDTNKIFSIMGVSLGGMIAVEMSEFLNPRKTIIVSSAKNRYELPFRYRFMKKIPVNKIFGGRFLRGVAPLAQIIVEPDSRKERETCKAMLKAKNRKFMKRSVNMIVNWNKKENNSKIIHIHGDKDRTIPLKNIKNPDYTIKGGSHMMILTKSDELQKIIFRFLNN